MLPVTRANLDHICCVCLLDVRPPMFTQKVYDVKEETNMSKVLKLTAHITVLKNPINQKYINDYCRKICEVCCLKSQYSYFFREKIMASTAALKELLESSELDDQDIQRLQHFCRICLNRQNPANAKRLNMQQLNWLKDCSGIRFTSLKDTQTFRIKEGTNINEIAVINDTQFPQQMCENCLKKLQNVEEFRKSATQSFEYMISVMGDANGPDLVPEEIKQFKENIIWKQIPQTQHVPVKQTNVRQDSTVLQFETNIKYEENFCSNVLQSELQTIHNIDDPIIVHTTDFSNTLTFDDDTLEGVMEFMDGLPHNSDGDDDNIGTNCTLNFGNEEDLSTNYSDRTNFLRKLRAKKSEQCEASNETEKCTTKQKHRKKIKKRLEGDEGRDLLRHREKRSRKAKQSNKTLTTAHTEEMKNADDPKKKFVCEKCSQMFATNSTLRRHEKTIHSSESNQTWHTCPICSREFKRKSHLVEHTKTVHEKQRPFKCSHCTKSFATNSSKRIHELTHTDEFPFACEWCGKRFRQSSRLKIHSEMHTTKPELLCPICKRSQKTPKDLENHLKDHDDKRLQCPSCGKLFNRSSHLKDHYNAVHLKLRPFKCEFCELSFGDRKTRRVHEKSHTEDRPITCTVCKRGFKHSISFNRHIKESGHSTEECKRKDKKTKKKSSKLLNLHYIENLNGILEPAIQFL